MRTRTAILLRRDQLLEKKREIEKEISQLRNELRDTADDDAAVFIAITRELLPKDTYEKIWEECRRRRGLDPSVRATTSAYHGTRGEAWTGDRL